MKKALIVSLLIVMAVSFSGCASLGISMSAIGESGSKSSSNSGGIMTVRGLSNNSTLDLEAGTYKALTINNQRVTITGQGTNRTFIRGPLVIEGNSCTIAGLTIQGDVIINANNADLSKAVIQGTVESNGKNNSW